MVTSKLGKVSAIVAFVLCLFGGLLILWQTRLSLEDNAIWTGMGLYFTGKAFFVGPALLLLDKGSKE